MRYEQPKLPYGYDALEPFIDARTMEVHYTKHHATYVAKLNDAVAKLEPVAEKPLEEFLADLDEVPADIRTVVKNSGGGAWNHAFFWTCLTPALDGSVNEPAGELRKAIDARWGGYMQFVAAFTGAATGLFGSGWAWLVRTEDGKLEIVTTANQDCPLSNKQTPLLALDLWEHAYYLRYQNRRAEYIENWWRIVHWRRVEELAVK
jgi:superoxide dismutase, Fe-Mn family